MSKLVLGIDSSTQSCKAVLVDADTGRIIDEGRAAHPAGTQVHPRHWLEAMLRATGGLIDQAAAVSVGGQQHGMVVLDEQNHVVRDAMLWNDTSSAPQAEEIVETLGGAQACADRIGSVMVASLTGSKLAWLRDNEPDNAARVAKVMLPHDYLNFDLTGRKSMFTDHGDASGTGYYNTAERHYDRELLTMYLGHEAQLPTLAGPNQAIGETTGGALVGPGTGDNMAAALGLDLQPGDVCISIGTSGVASTVSTHSVHDGTGLVTGFSDATGRYLPLSCTLNGAKVLGFAARLLGVDHNGLSAMALAGEPGAHGVSMLPYFDGERTPNRPAATGVLRGLHTTTSREDIARATVEGILCSMRDAMVALENATQQETKRVLLIGGGARSEAIRTIAPSIFGVDVLVPETGEYVAMGAARQAAWVLSGEALPPAWQTKGSMKHYSGKPDGDTVARYAELRDNTASW